MNGFLEILLLLLLQTVAK